MAGGVDADGPVLVLQAAGQARGPRQAGRLEGHGRRVGLVVPHEGRLELRRGHGPGDRRRREGGPGEEPGVQVADRADPVEVGRAAQLGLVNLRAPLGSHEGGGSKGRTVSRGA